MRGSVKLSEHVLVYDMFSQALKPCAGSIFERKKKKNLKESGEKIIQR